MSSSDDDEMSPEQRKEIADGAKKKGNTAFQNGDYDAAIKQYTMATRLDRNNHTVFSNLSASYAQVQQYSDALREAEMCISLKSDWAKGYTRKGLACYHLGSYEKALEAYQEAANLDPENDQLKEKLAEMTGYVAERRAEEGASTKEVAPADTAKPKSDTLGSADDQIKVLVEMLEESQMKWEFEQCIVYRDKIFELQKGAGQKQAPVLPAPPVVAPAPASPEVASAAAPAQGNGGGGGKNKKRNKKKNKNKGSEGQAQPEQASAKPAPAVPKPAVPKPKAQAVPTIHSTEDSSSDEETDESRAAKVALNKKRGDKLKDTGNECLKKGDLVKAISSYSMAIRLCPNEHTFYSNRSAAYLKDKDFKKALLDGNSCVELAPEWAKGYTRQGASFYSLKMVKCALQSYEKALELEPDNTSNQKQVDDLRPRAKESKPTIDEEKEWLRSDNREQQKQEACAQQ